MTELPNIILPSDLVSVDQSGPHSAPPSMSMTSDSNPSHISTREIKHTSLDSTVHFSYSNSIDRHNHNESPYLVPRSATSVFDQQNGRDFSDDVSTPLSNLLNSVSTRSACFSLASPLYPLDWQASPSPALQTDPSTAIILQRYWVLRCKILGL